IKDVEVRALDEKGTIIEKTKTDENGNFTLSLPAGKYTLNIGGELGAISEYSYETYTTDVTVSSNVWTVLKDNILLNRATMRIAGNVYDSESKEPLADVEVKAYRVVNGTSEYVSSGTSNANGEYVINISKNGTYNLEFTKSGYTTATQNSVMTFGNLTYADWQYLVKNNTSNDNVFAGGDGTEANPYQVSTPEQLNAVRNDLSAHYIQINDIDMSDWGNWEPIGNSDNIFVGSYNGKNYNINGITINSTSENNLYIGLFGRASGKIANINMTDFDIKSLYLCNYVGSIIGYGSILENCKSNGQIDALCQNGGGLVGYASYINDSVSNVTCNFKCTDKNTSGFFGGICGSGGTIKHSENHGTVYAESIISSYIGGISGKASLISKCYNNANLKLKLSGSNSIHPE
ncbi:MAG: carboxypeptidase regulatory-like domain-containing protein, partial [Eubacterium sp.]|nr:carboxypeptidase regulatory-like domain-containing protein [Eubacterium sp.]